jgi:hypothetical protein
MPHPHALSRGRAGETQRELSSRGDEGREGKKEERQNERKNK